MTTAANRPRLAAALQRLAGVFICVRDDASLAFTSEETRNFAEIGIRHILDTCYGNEPTITDEECEFFERLTLRFEEVAAAPGCAASVQDPGGTSIMRTH